MENKIKPCITLDRKNYSSMEDSLKFNGWCIALGLTSDDRSAWTISHIEIEISDAEVID